MGDNAPSLLSRNIRVLGPRNSCQGHKDFWCLSSRDRPQLGRALGGFGTVDTHVSKEGRFGVVDRALGRKPASILLPPVFWSESFRCLSKGSTGLFSSGKPEDNAKVLSSWDWKFPRVWEIRTKDKRNFGLIEKVGCGMWNHRKRAIYREQLIPLW